MLISSINKTKQKQTNPVSCVDLSCKCRMNSLKLTGSWVSQQRLDGTPSMRPAVTAGGREEVMGARNRKWLLNCQLSRLLASTGQSLQQLDRISDKAAIRAWPPPGPASSAALLAAVLPGLLTPPV